MAKVTGPLMSLDARGKLGSVLVFIGWKGIKTVRQWLKPANPKSASQGDIRLAIGGLGRAAGKVGVDGGIHTQLKTLNLIPDQQSKQSYLVQYIKDNYFAGTGATFTAAYVAMLAELTGHTRYSVFLSAADDLEILAFDLDYASIDPFNKALGIYLIAKASVALNFTGSPYSIALASWTTANIAEFTADFAAA
jgi:hypothetical protein